MNANIYYQEHKQYGNRYKTDSLLMDNVGKRDFKGVADKHARLVQECQLKFKSDWDLFVEQFKTKSDDDDLGWRCEYFGKMMRGSCMTYQYTKDEELYEILTDIAVKMLATQDELGRIASYSVEKEFDGWDLWGRKYVILGFLHYHEICRDEELKQRIITVLEKHLDYITERIGNEGQKPVTVCSRHWLGVNSASLLEPVVRMYNITKKSNYLKFAEHILYCLWEGRANILTVAYNNELKPHEYPVRKAYEMMSCFEGAYEYYRLTGEEKYKIAVENFVNKVYETEISIIGCSGCEHELFNNTLHTQTDTSYKGIMQETCVTVTWMKICNQLLSLTGDKKYADMIEYSCYNALYGAVNTAEIVKNGGFMFDSYSPIFAERRGRGAGGCKRISPDRYYGCCVAIGAAGTSLLPLTAVMTNNNGITVNYYEKGKVESSEGFELEFITEYPFEGKVIINILKAPCDEKNISFRIPQFTENKANARLNGDGIAVSGGVLSITRNWKSGDVVELEFDMNLRVVFAPGMDEKPETKDFFGVIYGPIVLARDQRITDVGCAVELDNHDATIEILDDKEIDCNIRAKVTVGGNVLDMIDYCSAGKTCSDDSKCEAWVPFNRK